MKYRPKTAQTAAVRPCKPASGNGPEDQRRRAPRTIAGLLALLASLALLTAQVVLAAPPEGVDFTVSDANPDVDEPVTFTASATDADGDALTYEWDFDGGAFSAQASGPSVTRSFATAGPRSVTLRVSDGTTPVSVSNAINVVAPNQNPTGSFTFAGAPPANGNTPYVGQTVAFSATGSDPDGGPVTYEWTFGDGGSATGPNVTHAYGSRGAKSVQLTVRDNRGGTGGQGQTVNVNALPVADAHILNAAAEPGQSLDVPLVGQAFAFTGGGPLPGAPTAGSTDAEGTIAAYAWDLDNNGTFETAGQNAASPGYTTPGQRTVSLRVTDSNGATNVESLTFRVNSAPIPGFILDPPTPAVNRAVQFSSTSSDPNGDPLTYAWDLDGDSSFGEAFEQGPNPVYAFTSAGNKTVRLRVTDTGGISRTVTRSVLVQLSIPNTAYSYGPEAPLPGQAVTFTSKSGPSDPGKQITGVEWDFDYDRSTDTFTTDATGGSASHAFATPGPKIVAMKATEGPAGGYGITVGTIVVNAPPQADFTATPASPFTGDQLTLSSTSRDPDGPIARQEWDLDGDGQFDDGAGSVVPWVFKKSGTQTVRLRVTDAKGASAVAAGQIVVRKRPLLTLSGVVIGIEGSITGRFTKVRRLLVQAPRGARVTVKCRGRSCPKAAVKKGKGLAKTVKGRALRFRALEGKMGPGVKIVVTVTKSGYLGKRTTFTTRVGRKPLRVNRCLVPGAKSATRCPAS